MKIPVILDTDIGSDIDDTWALGLLLKSPEVDLRLAVSATGDTTYRARLLAKMLQTAGRSDVPVGVGLDTQDESRRAFPQAAWVEGYDLADYPGQVHMDGVGAMIEAILASPQPVTVLGIGPLPNIAEALRREPRIALNARFVGMHGSLRRGYDGAADILAEYNVNLVPPACRAAFSAPWDVTITPLDPCGLIRLEGEAYRRVRDSADPIARMIIENYRLWLASNQVDWLKGVDAEAHSTVLFDTVAAYLTFSEELLEMELLGVRVDGEGVVGLGGGRGGLSPPRPRRQGHPLRHRLERPACLRTPAGRAPDWRMSEAHPSWEVLSTGCPYRWKTNPLCTRSAPPTPCPRSRAGEKIILENVCTVHRTHIPQTPPLRKP